MKPIYIVFLSLGLWAAPAVAQTDVVVTPDSGPVTVSAPADAIAIDVEPDAAVPVADAVAPDDSATSADGAVTPADATMDDQANQVLAPSTPQQVVDATKDVWNAAKTGETVAIASAAIFLLLLLLRLPALGSITNKIPKRWRIVVVILLSALTGVFNSVALGTPWGPSMFAALFTAPSAVFSNELFVESLFGMRYKSGS